MTNPVSLNAFAYASARPALLTDPSGLDSYTHEDELKTSVETTLDAIAGSTARRIPGAFVRETTVQIARSGTVIETLSYVEYPLLRRLLESKVGGAVVGGAVQGIADWFFHPELTGQQRAGRVAVAVAITAVAVVLAPAIVSAAALTGVTAVLATAAVGGIIGFVLDRTLVQPIIYPRFGLGK